MRIKRPYFVFYTLTELKFDELLPKSFMNRQLLEERTMKFHIDILVLSESLPRNTAGFEIAKQIIRSSGSVGANYRSSKRAKSKADFICKIEIVLEEADETLYWLEIIRDASLINSNALTRLIIEANELTAIFAATDKTAKKNCCK